MISVDEAYRLIIDRVPNAGEETLPVENITGRILQESIVAERDAPPFDRVMMDGFAIRYHEPLAGRFTIRGVALAGHESPVLEKATDCVEVTTGCPLPDGCDTVIPVEDCTCEGTTMRLSEDARPKRFQFLHARGSDGAAGRVVLEPGTYVGPPELAILATEGVVVAKVAKIPRIQLVTTGDEVVVDGGKLTPSQIRGSHYEALRGLFHPYLETGLKRLHAKDTEEDLRQKLYESLQDTDILLITGGVSRGRKDLVPDILKEMGVKEILHRVTQRPGKPLWFGIKGEKLVFGLPGNPISSLICARRYVFPVIEKWMGAMPRQSMRVSIDGEIDSIEGFTRFVPVNFNNTGGSAEPFTTSGSLHDLAGTDGFIEVPPRGNRQETLKFFPWNSR